MEGRRVFVKQSCWSRVSATRLWLTAIGLLTMNLVVSGFTASGLPGLTTISAAEKAPSVAPPSAVDYVRDVKPIFREKCYACHGGLKQESGLRVDTAALASKGGDSGTAIVAGDSAESLLLQRIVAKDPDERMPPDAPALTADQIAIIVRWIDAGATGPGDERPESDPSEHWAFQIPVRPDVPVVENPEWVLNPIDAFVARQHQQQSLQTSGPAEKAVLLRRVYLDLIGLPPTPEQLQTFLDDPSPDAYARSVRELLDSPQYGERWGRHWMDIWRYSDWYGRRYVPDVWNSAPQVWRWRDWIVRSLNTDAGYDRMVQSMLAADEIMPEDAESAVATGYLIRNWYALNPNDWMRANVEHTGKAFLGLTFNCAHCHDHKYDPITHDDYFRFRAFFEPIGVRQDRVPGEAAPGPFQEYDYSTLRKVQRLGAVRIFDSNPEAPTWFYTGGDERNRVKEKGSMTPGLPAIFTSTPIEISEIALPPSAWYPGLRPEIQQTIRDERVAVITEATTNLQAAQQQRESTLPKLLEQQQIAEAEFKRIAEAAKMAGEPVALSGRQSLVLDATAGRRILNKDLSHLQALNDGAKLQFQVKLLSNTHFNFQLAKDAIKGLTAGYVAFDQGRILSYEPGTFTEFEAGRYDYAAGENAFEVTLIFQTAENRCLLTVRRLSEQTELNNAILVDSIPVALTGWSPVADPTKTITFDAHTGSVVLIDEVSLHEPPPADPSMSAVRLVHIDFEPPSYADAADVVGVDGWSASSFCRAPATSLVSQTAGSAELRAHALQLKSARQAVQAQELAVAAADAKLTAARLELKSLEARIAADRARFTESDHPEMESLRAAAIETTRQATLKTAEADVLQCRHQLAVAEAKPESDEKRAKEIEAADKALATAKDVLSKASAVNGETPSEASYASLTPTHPATSTGRRKALAEWMTDRSNPLTARVAVNHIWNRHFHTPLVSSVFDFGRNGAAPTHPELLDWLAVEFMDSGWSMKHLHFLIVTSNTYRMTSSSGDHPENVDRDPENVFLWRMNVGRMQSEVIRDSLLHCADRLDLRMGGQELENTEALTNYRRSLYFSCHPEVGGKSEFGGLFDAPNAMECYRRTNSVVPQQALALTNSELIHTLSRELADTLAGHQGDGKKVAAEALPKFVALVYRRILSRDPSAAEAAVCIEFLNRQTALLESSQVDQPSVRACESLIRAIFNHNDFVTIR